MAWWKTGDRPVPKPIMTKDLYSLNGRTSHRKITWSLEAARWGVIIVSLWNLISILAALLPMCLSNFKAIGKVWTWISRLRDFTRSCGKTPVRLVNRGSDYWLPHISLKAVCLPSLLTGSQNAKPDIPPRDTKPGVVRAQQNNEAADSRPRAHEIHKRIRRDVSTNVTEFINDLSAVDAAINNSQLPAGIQDRSSYAKEVLKEIESLLPEATPGEAAR